MEDMYRRRLVKASDVAVKKKVPHILLTVTEDGVLRINGSSMAVENLLADQGIYKEIDRIMKVTVILRNYLGISCNREVELYGSCTIQLLRIRMQQE